MSRKREIAKEIRMLEAEIQGLEIKRSRSMAALLENVIRHIEPDPKEVEYFRAFTAQIDVKRDALVKATKELEAII